MPASFPGAIFAPRAKANAPGVVYDPDKITVGYAEDLQKLDAEVVAIENALGENLENIKPSFVNRGDPDDNDFGLGNGVVCDGSPRDLDLSALVPAGATAVLLQISLQSDNQVTELAVWPKGNTGSRAWFYYRNLLASEQHPECQVVPISADRKITYQSLSLSYDLCDVIIMGWFK
jgi:hypothetical protein